MLPGCSFFIRCPVCFTYRVFAMFFRKTGQLWRFNLKSLTLRGLQVM